MQDGEALDPRVSLAEDTAGGVAPAFQAEGFARPARVPLIEGGRLVGSLVSPRTAREFGARRERRQRRGDAGVARDGRRRRSPRTTRSRRSTPASRSATCTTSTTPTGPPCRITGMTRFATFWVENGKVVAPVDVLRFDDTRLPACSARTSRR